MSHTFSYLKQCLKTEFETVCKEEDFSMFPEVELVIMNTEEADDEWGDKKNGYLMYDIDDMSKKCSVVLCIYIDMPIEESDRKLMEKYNVEDAFELCFFMLYHELGHLADIEESYFEHGLPQTKQKLYAYENDSLALELALQRNEMEQQETQIIYQELSFEKYANEYAGNLFHKRMETIREYKRMRGIEI